MSSLFVHVVSVTVVNVDCVVVVMDVMVVEVTALAL